MTIIIFVHVITELLDKLHDKSDSNREWKSLVR